MAGASVELAWPGKWSLLISRVVGLHKVWYTGAAVQLKGWLATRMRPWHGLRHTTLLVDSGGAWRQAPGRSPEHDSSETTSGAPP